MYAQAPDLNGHSFDLPESGHRGPLKKSPPVPPLHSLVRGSIALQVAGRYRYVVFCVRDEWDDQNERIGTYRMLRCASSHGIVHEYVGHSTCLLVRLWQTPRT